MKRKFLFYLAAAAVFTVQCPHALGGDIRILKDVNPRTKWEMFIFAYSDGLWDKCQAYVRMANRHNYHTDVYVKGKKLAEEEKNLGIRTRNAKYLQQSGETLGKLERLLQLIRNERMQLKEYWSTLCRDHKVFLQYSGIEDDRKITTQKYRFIVVSREYAEHGRLFYVWIHQADTSSGNVTINIDSTPRPEK